MIRSFRHYAFAVPDVALGRDFFEDFGLTAHDRGNHVALRCAGRALDQVVLLQDGPRKRFHHLSFGTGVDELDRLKHKLEAHGTKLLDAPYEGAPSGLWFRDPAGNLTNVTADATPEPRAGKPYPANGPAKRERLGAMGCLERGHVIKPARLMHCILFAPDTKRLSAFYIDILGMQLSDTVGGDFARFMRTAGSSDHHVLGLLKSEKTGFHHASFEVETLDEIVLGGAAMVEKGHRHVWGPGRHVVGSNLFQYLRDPWNSMVEYSLDIDYIPADVEWKARDWGKDGMFLWASDGPPPADFGQNFEIAG